ncbi:MULTISPECIES: hypothetical protein [unclassified Caballeronia]|uniref:hypothetical protein n=1 Tax=unclassified Caballeronia TaxID=2646786 RepID=UPI0028617B31|nr:MULTISPECIES: hypothetical protein [unclassified Caballeronia]MDR5736601.1 hypothetical protein [Caballeronia sp. LZ016]MDR5810919.1 hypothetical protein [Caballeronia sp. LZ019]
MFYAAGGSFERGREWLRARGPRVALMAMSALALGMLMSGCGVVGCVGTSVYGIGLTVC